MKKKQELYSIFIARMAEAAERACYLEASWYAYAVLEDRLRSLLRSTGGELNAKGKPIKMMGPKLAELKERIPSNVHLSTLDVKALETWKDDRNELMHAMAEGSLTIEQIDAQAAKLTSDGVSLAKSLAALARRMKARKAKLET